MVRKQRSLTGRCQGHDTLMDWPTFFSKLNFYSSMTSQKPIWILNISLGQIIDWVRTCMVRSLPLQFYLGKLLPWKPNLSNTYCFVPNHRSCVLYSSSNSGPQHPLLLTVGAVCESVCLDMDRLFEESRNKLKAMRDCSATGKAGAMLCLPENNPRCIEWYLLIPLSPFKAIHSPNCWSPFPVYKSALQVALQCVYLKELIIVCDYMRQMCTFTKVHNSDRNIVPSPGHDWS